jgi:hypothetical protein
VAAISAGTTGGMGDMPSGDEIAAQVELFLSSLEDPDDPEKETDA